MRWFISVRAVPCDLQDLSLIVLQHSSVTVTCTGYRHTKFPISYPFSVSYVVPRELSMSENVLFNNLINIYVELGPCPRRLLVDDLFSVVRHCLPIVFAAAIPLWCCHGTTSVWTMFARKACVDVYVYTHTHTHTHTWVVPITAGTNLKCLGYLSDT